MKKPSKLSGEDAERELLSLPYARKEKLIHDVLEDEDGEHMCKMIAGLMLLGYTGHTFEASIPSGKHIIKITAEYVDEGEE